MDQDLNTSPKPKKSKTGIIVIALLVLAALLAGGVYMWRQTQVKKLQDQVSTLEKTQLPQKQYESYEDCIANNAPPLNTINGQFNACLGGNTDESGDLPQYQAFLQYSAQNLPRLLEDKVNESGDKNVILEGATASADLTTFLESEYAGCGANSADEAKFEPAYITVVKEVPGRFALTMGGCSKNDEYYSISIKLADGWRGISTTNNMDEEGLPSCLVVDMFKISKKLTKQCFENTGYNNGTLKDVIYE